MRYDGKKIIITGGAGFIGSTVAKYMVNQGAEVHVIDNLWRGTLDNINDILDDKRERPISFVNADLTDPVACLLYIQNADIVIHLADVVAGINFVFNNEHYIFRQNVIMNSNVLSACIKNGIKQYVYVGTACSYPRHLQMQDKPVQFKEDQAYPALPESSYGWSKLMGEYEAELAQKDIEVGLLRLHNVYGPFSYYQPDRAQVIPSLIRKAIEYPREEFIVWGSGEQSRDFIYVDDVVRGIALLLEKGMNKGVIQVGSERSVTIREIAELVVKISGKAIVPFYDTGKPEGDRGRIADCTRARDILGWNPEVSIEEGLARTYKWLENTLKKEAS